MTLDDYIAGAAYEVQGLHMILEAGADGSMARRWEGYLESEAIPRPLRDRGIGWIYPGTSDGGAPAIIVELEDEG